MIVSDIHNWPSEAQAVHGAIRDAVAFLTRTDFTAMPAGRYTVQGNLMFCLLQDVHTQDAVRIRPESHREHIDVQYLVSGMERIGHARLTPGCQVDDDSEQDDILFYGQVDRETAITLLPGMFAVFFPSDIHRPCCRVGAPAPIKKAVVKIHRSLLAGILTS